MAQLINSKKIPTKFLIKNNYKNDSNDMKPGTGDMNILAVPSKDSQTNDLLELSSYDEDWDQNKLIDFYNSNNLPLI